MSKIESFIYVMKEFIKSISLSDILVFILALIIIHVLDLKTLDPYI